MREHTRVGRRVALAVGAWILVVVSGSWLVWTVIAAAGGSFVGTAGSVPFSPGSTAPTAPTAHRTPTRAASTPATPPTTPSSSAPAPSAPVTPRSTADATVRSRTWTGAPGIVTVRCTGSRIELGGAAVTANGYAVEVGRRGPDVVEVEFHRRPDGGGVRVVARCGGGSPVFSVANDD